MSLTIYSHNDCFGHAPPEGHPERPARLEAALRGIQQLHGFRMLDARPVDRGQLERAHGASYLDQLERMDASGGLRAIDEDTYLGPGTLRAASLAAGAACQAVDTVMDESNWNSAFAVVRPPGHHAEATRAMGFCFYSSVAVAALYARDALGINRIAVCDFDVHHGNGTEAVLAEQAGVLFVSSHQSPLYPGTGRADDKRAPNIINCPLPPQSGSNEFRDHWSEHLLPAVEKHKPQLILVSAGFDAHWRDPLAQLQLKDEDFYWIGHELKAIARRHASGRLAASLEGGYDLKALEESTLAFAEGIG